MKYQIIVHFRELKGGRLFEGRAHIRGGRLFDNLVSRIGALRVGSYSRGCLIEALQYNEIKGLNSSR